MELLLLIIGCGVLGYEMVYADLAYCLKLLFLLHKEQPVVVLLSSLKAYRKIIGDKLTTFLFPLILLIILLATVHRFIYKLLSCPYCTSFQLTFWIAVIAFNQTVLLSILIAGCSLLATGVYDLIKSKLVI